MNRNKRTVVVVLVAVLLAAVASLGMYRVVSARPATRGQRRQDRRRGRRAASAAARHPADPGPRQAGQVAGGDAGSRRLREGGRGPGPRPHRDGRGERTADRGQAGAARGGGWPAAIDSSGHARRLGQGQRSGRRGRLRRSRHSRRRHGDADEPPGAAGQRDPRGRQQRPGAHRGHPLRPGEREGRQADSLDRGDPAGVAGRRRANRAGGVRGPNHADAPQSAGYVTDDHSGTRTTALFGQPAVAAPASPRAPRASAPAKPVQPEPAAAPAPKIYTVEAIRGAKRSEEIVR